jgi:transposase-like protein
MIILADIKLLPKDPSAHITQLYQITKHCIHCGSIHIKKNGTYLRKTHIGNAQSELNIVQRMFCNDCRRSFRILPMHLAPERWYQWAVLAMVLIASLQNKSIRSINKYCNVARSTISRWLRRFKEHFAGHADQLKQLLPDLGRINGFTHFWQICLSHISLAEAMVYLSNAGVVVP